MLDSGWHQGSSLLASPVGSCGYPSVIPSGQAEDLHALWQACAALQAQGYPVMILDGLESETDQAPGLEDVLQGCSSTALPAHLTPAPRHCPACLRRGACKSWPIGHKPVASRPWGSLYRHFRNHALLVVLAPAPLLGAVCKGVQQAPWLLVPTKRHSVVACYPRAQASVHGHRGHAPVAGFAPSAYRVGPALEIYSAVRTPPFAC